MGGEGRLARLEQQQQRPRHRKQNRTVKENPFFQSHPHKDTKGRKTKKSFYFSSCCGPRCSFNLNNNLPQFITRFSGFASFYFKKKLNNQSCCFHLLKGGKLAQERKEDKKTPVDNKGKTKNPWKIWTHESSSPPVNTFFGEGPEGSGCPLGSYRNGAFSLLSDYIKSLPDMVREHTHTNTRVASLFLLEVDIKSAFILDLIRIFCSML